MKVRFRVYAGLAAAAIAAAVTYAINPEIPIVGAAVIGFLTAFFLLPKATQ
jgi:hypothetical protein